MWSKYRKIFYPFIAVIIIFFIFYNSSKNGTESSNTSTLVLNMINNFFQSINLNFSLSGHFVRKLAHFVEFCALGIFITFSFESFSNKIFKFIPYILFLCLFIPVIDEFIQLFSEGRTSSVADIILDFSSSVVGIIYVFVWSNIKIRFKNKKLGERYDKR